MEGRRHGHPGEGRSDEGRLQGNLQGDRRHASRRHLRCAGEDYRINATNKLTNKGGKIKGSWNEATYDANGGVTGTAKDKTIHARISGDKFSGRMSINVSDTGHEINIMQLNEDTGTYRQAASVSLHR